MAELRQFARPMVGCGTRLEADKARRQFLKKAYDLAAPQLLADSNILVAIDAMNLEYVLGDIQPDRANLHVDGSLMCFVATITLWQSVAGSGRRPPHQKQTLRGGLLDDLVRFGGEIWRDLDAERFGSLEVDNELKFDRLHHRKVAGLFNLENPPDVDADLAIAIAEVGPVAHQATR